MTLTLAASLLVLSVTVACFVEVGKTAVRCMYPGFEDSKHEPGAYRALSLFLGAGIAVLTLDDWTRELVTVYAVYGAMAGGASELVYRWWIRAIPRLLREVEAAVRRHLGGK